MGTALNIYFEIFGTLMFFAMFWLLFYTLHYQESKTRRILLIIGMALYRPLLAVFQLSDLFELLFPAVMIAILAALAGWEKKSVWITAAYFFFFFILADAITTAMVLGLTGSRTCFGSLTNTELYFYGGIFPYMVLFSAAVCFYLIMRAAPQSALDRIPLPVWIALLLMQPAGTAAFYIPLDSLLTQQEAGYNNFLFIGFSLLMLFVLNLVMVYLFVHFAVSYSARLLAGEIHKTPPVYSQSRGLSPEFIERYGLSDREAEITEALLGGKSNKEIAVLLGMEANTVQAHLRHIYRKTGSPGRYALMALRTHELKEQAEIAAASSRSKSAFLATMSHEIKTPLTAVSVHVQQAAELFSADDGGAEKETIASSLSRAQEEVMRAARITENALRLASMQEGQKQMEVLRIDTLLTNSAEAYRAILEKRGNKLNLAITDGLGCDRVYGNADQLSQGMGNLLSNANRHTKGGNITVKTESDGGSIIIVTVTDNGSGIAPELLPHIFERGVSGTESSGLGLEICKRIIESHGGTISAESVPGKGTAVRFTVPVYRGEPDDV
jgi:signal transduction histidine kinase